jgi:hypothetical protein
LGYYVDVLRGLPGFETLKGAKCSAGPQPIYMVIDCNLAEAELFLKIAKDHCATVVPAIENAMTLARNKRQA